MALGPNPLASRSLPRPSPNARRHAWPGHGEHGQSEPPEIPSLGGQTTPYVLIQLYLFREKQRTLEIMNEMTKAFTDDDLRAFFDFISKAPPSKPPADAGDAARTKRAAGLITQNRCNGCHNLDLSGRDNIPRIADQREKDIPRVQEQYAARLRRHHGGGGWRQ